MKLATAQAKVRSVRGSSFLVKGSDDFDHKGMKKARRAIDRALVEEALDTSEPTKVDMKWVVEAYRCDGDKWWLDSYDVVFVSDSYKLANDRCVAEDEGENLTTNGDPAPKSRLTYRDITNDLEVQWFMEREARYKSYRDRLWDDYSI